MPPYERLVPVGQRPNFPAHTFKQLYVSQAPPAAANSPLNMAPAYPGAHQASCPPGGYKSSEWVSMQGHRRDRSSTAASATPAAADHLAAWRLAPLGLGANAKGLMAVLI